jgi:hypothetical protein
MHSFVKTAFYEITLKNVPRPPLGKQQFHPPNGNKLGICLIEFRKHEWIRYVLYQIANIYGNTDTSLYIVHGTKNAAFVREIVKDWKHVQFIGYPYENITREKYAELCCDETFYKHFKTEFMLKMEWDSFIRKRIPDHFFNYSYVGAPWTGYPNDYPNNPHIRVGNKLVGNGGFSLRNVKRMIEVCHSFPKPAKLGEDVHLTNCLEDHEIPSVDLAKTFSVEWVFDPDPVGIHQVFKIFPTFVFMRWFKNTEYSNTS